MFSEEKIYGNGGNLAELPAPAALLIIPFFHGERGLVAVSLIRISTCSAACAFVHNLAQGGLPGGPIPGNGSWEAWEAANSLLSPRKAQRIYSVSVM